MRYLYFALLFAVLVGCSNHGIRFTKARRTVHDTEQQDVATKSQPLQQRIVFESDAVEQANSKPSKEKARLNADSDPSFAKWEGASDELPALSAPQDSTETSGTQEKTTQALAAEVEAESAKKSMIAALVMFFLLPLVWIIPFIFGIRSINRADRSRYITEQGERDLQLAIKLKKVIIGFLIAGLILAALLFLIIFVFV